VIQRLCIIGVGLIGGSLARGLRAAGACEEIVGCSRRPETLEKALELGVIDRGELEIGRAVEGADMVVLAVPLGAMASAFRALNGHLADGAVVTDVGSAKQCVIRAANEVCDGPTPWLVPGHPIAGTEKSGVAASFAELFSERRVILTPTPETEPQAVARVRDMWQQVGAEVIEMDAGHHDQVLAATSHLPHMLAYTLVDVLGRMEEHEEIFQYAAGGFRDFTRIASSDPQMWHDICIANADDLVNTLEHFSDELKVAIEAVRAGDSETIKSLFVRAKALRDRYTEATTDSSKNAP